MARGRKGPSSTPRAASGTNSPFEVMEDSKSGPRPSRGDEIRTATAMRTGTAASTSSPIWLRRRPAISLSSDRSRREDSRRDRGTPPPRGTPLGTSARTGSAADIETLPGERDEQVLEAGTRHGELLDADAALDKGRDDRLRREAVWYPADPARHRLDVVEPE